MKEEIHIVLTNVPDRGDEKLEVILAGLCASLSFIPGVEIRFVEDDFIETISSEATDVKS